MKIGDEVFATDRHEFPDKGVVRAITEEGDDELDLHVSFNGSGLAWRFIREDLEYADA